MPKTPDTPAPIKRRMVDEASPSASFYPMPVDGVPDLDSGREGGSE